MEMRVFGRTGMQLSVLCSAMNYDGDVERARRLMLLVREGFAWGALFLGPFWLAAHRAWIAAWRPGGSPSVTPEESP